MIALKLVLYAILLIGIPVCLSILIFRFVKKRNYPPKYRLLALIPLLYLGYVLYTSLVKPYSFYEGHFESITGLELPSTTEFLDYDDWGYGTTPRNNSSLFHIKVEPGFYEKLKDKLKPSTQKLEGVDEDYAFRFHKMFGEDFQAQLDLQYAKFNDDGELVSVVGFFEKERALLVFYWND